MNFNPKDSLKAPLNDRKIGEELKLPQQAEPIQPQGVNYDIYDKANFLSKLFFHWVLSILMLAKKTKLSPELLGKVSSNSDSRHYSARIEHFWETKGYKNKPSNALMKTLLRTNIWRLTTVIVLSLISSGLQYLSILILKEYIDYFENPQARRFTLLQLGITFLVAQFLYILVTNHTNIILNFLGFRAKYELNCFIYNKVLKVSPSSFKDKASHGEIINFIQVDSNKISSLMLVSTDLVSAPIMIGAYIYLLFDFFGVSFFTGLGIIAVFFLINYFLFKQYRVIAQEMLQKVDKRMKLTTEVFDSIKILKLYNWENEFKQRILDAREEEVLKIKRRLMLSTINISLFWLCPVFVSIGTIGVYIFLEKSFNISTMLIGLALFSRLQDPVRDLPWSINGLLETFISMGRIEKFINQPEYVESNVIVEDAKDKPYAIKIENGTFTWGKIPTKEKEGDEKEAKPNSNKKLNSSVHQSKDGNIAIDRIDEQINTKTKDEIREKINQNDSFGNLLPRNTITTEVNEKQSIEGVDSKDYDIVLSNINLEIKQGETVGIIGEVGSGKTSLLQAILNSLILISKDKCDGIHVTGSIGYVSQTPWIQNDTIRNNITFFSKYNEEKYQRVLEESQLKFDLNNLEGNDLTEIGEKGINLSGGQKVRVSLARALYANPDIYLLDDPISALDANIGRKIIDDCLLKFLKNKTRLITTHALYFLKDLDKIIYIDKGQIKWSGTYDELTYQDFFSSLSKMEKERKKSHKLSIDETDIVIGGDNEDDNDEDDEVKEEKKEPKLEVAKKLMKEEDQEIGVVKKEIYVKYCIYMGGVCFVFMVAVVMLLWFLNKGGSDLWLAYWSKSENQDPDKKLFFFAIYSALGIGSAVFIFFRIFMLSMGSVKLCRTLHKDMLTSLIKAPINLFHEIVPRGQVHNRLSKDMESLMFLMFSVGNVLVGLFSLIGAIAICGIYDLYSLIFIPLFAVTGYLLTSFYLIGKRALSRLEKTSSSPILNTISETIPGVISIKTFRRLQDYLNRFYQSINDNYKVNIFFYGSDTWYKFQFDGLSFLFAAYLVVYTNIFEASATPQSVGLMFTYSLVLQNSLQLFFRFSSILETQMVSMERCLKYTQIEGELPSALNEDIDLIQQAWPQAGKIEFINYSVKYRPNTEVVLKSLSFTINPKEKIGIIGRTGSGKSTVCLCLFRILEPLSGTIFIDDVDITKIGLDLLRQNISIIPQDPTLMQGTLRYNIDPFNTKTDEEILSILHSIGFNINDSVDSLQKVIEERGNNLSVGERQLVCIARAMLRKTKIIIMDEATANIDIKTEERIQRALKMVMESSTILTIAHRIKTIVNYDRILVLDNGNVAEFDSPENLLKNKASLFYELYSKSSL